MLRRREVTASSGSIGALLSRVGGAGAFAAQRTAPASDLRLEVKGFGPLRFPISPAAAKRLCGVARPARYGLGEKTLLDRRVRDAWEIPRGGLKLDSRRWNQTLLPMLRALGADLGLPAGCRFHAELHDLLVYGPGQFFRSHQDSEKRDDMVGTLVVTMPSRFQGGALAIMHKGKQSVHRRSGPSLSFVAFYADCRHEVRPVTSGYRIVLTYNLMLEGEPAAAHPPAATKAAATIAARLREHFETPRPPPAWEKDARPRAAPDRLVYLLDHEYTEHSLGWHRLKGDDAVRVAVLRSATGLAGCETALALAEIQETWSCAEDYWEAPRSWRRRSWEEDEEDEWENESEPAGDDGHTLVELQDWSITLKRWVPPGAKEAQPVLTHIHDDEVCSSTPTSELEPYASEHEGYMGNYGNTMDR
jgi:hypothetical protein